MGLEVPLRSMSPAAATLVMIFVTAVAAAVVTVAEDVPGLSRVFVVNISKLRPGSTWVLVSWEPDLVDVGADGRLNLIISYRWSTISGTINTVYTQPHLEDPRGFSPTSHNLTGLSPDTWYGICLNATHTIASVLQPAFSCLATHTLLLDGEVPNQSVLNREYSVRQGATWMDIRVDEFHTPFTIVQWMVMGSAQAAPKYELPHVVHYRDHWVREGDQATEHVFHLEPLRPDTDYLVTILARYKVNVADNKKVLSYEDKFVVKTNVSSALSLQAPTSLIALTILLATGILARVSWMLCS